MYAFCVVNVVTAALHANTLESPKGAKRRTGKGKTRRMQEAFAAHLWHVGPAYPAGERKRVVLVIDNAPWPRGNVVAKALADNRHLELYRLPSYSPMPNPIGRFRRCSGGGRRTTGCSRRWRS